MIRNDYRRALILLRSAVKGMSGHVRLERRTLAGSMRFSVTGAGSSDNLRALLLRKGKSGWAAVPMGALNVDNRGQAGLTWTFDPRNIEGYTLEDYPIVAVVRVGGNAAAELALSGFLGSSAEVDWVHAMRAAAALYRRGDRAVSSGQVQEDRRRGGEDAAEPEPVGGLPEAEAEQPQDQEVWEQPTEERIEAGLEVQEQTEELNAPDGEGGGAAEESEKPTEVGMASEGIEAEEGAETGEGAGVAGDQMALDINAAWPEPIEPLRVLFQRLPACAPFQADGYTFVRAPLPGSGLAYSLVGVRVEDERPTSVCYGIPGAFALEPPAGLDGYMWREEGAGGWWVTFVDALTGEEIAE